LKVAVQQAVRELAKNGAPELGMDYMDPLQLGNFTLTQGNGPVAITLKVENGKLLGYKKMNIVSVRLVDFFVLFQILYRKLSQWKDFESERL
jgi:hypothetical protein